MSVYLSTFMYVYICIYIHTHTFIYDMKERVIKISSVIHAFIACLEQVSIICTLPLDYEHGQLCKQSFWLKAILVALLAV